MSWGLRLSPNSGVNELFLNLDGGSWSELCGCSGGWADPLLPSLAPQPAHTCLLSCCLPSFFQPPPHSPTSPLRKQPGQGRTRLSLLLRGASRPQPASIQMARPGGGGGGGRRAAWGRGAGRKSRRGRGAAPVRALGAAGCRAPGWERPATEGPRRARGGDGPALTEPGVPAAGAPGRGLSGCTLHRATPAPSLQHFGVTGMGPSPQQPISGHTGAGARSRKPGLEQGSFAL